MSKPVVIPWLPSLGNTAAIAPVQTIGAGGGFLSLTGNPFIFDRVIRKVSITGGIGTPYTITGIGSPVDGNGNPIQVLGPINEVVVGAIGAQSVNIYKSVTSISAAGAGLCSAGFGTSGITDYVFYDYNRNVSPCASFQAYFTVIRTGIIYTGYISLTKPEFPAGDVAAGTLTSGYPLAAFPISAAFTNAITNQLDYVVHPYSVAWLSISGTQADSLIFTVHQQGI